MRTLTVTFFLPMGIALMFACGLDQNGDWRPDDEELSGTGGKGDLVQPDVAETDDPCLSYSADVKVTYWGIGRSDRAMRNEFESAYEKLDAQFERFEVDDKTMVCGPRLTVLNVTSRWWGPPNKEYTIQTKVELPDPICYELLESYGLRVEDIPFLLLKDTFFSQIGLRVDRIPEYGFGGVPTDYDYAVTIPQSHYHCD